MNLKRTYPIYSNLIFIFFNGSKIWRYHMIEYDDKTETWWLIKLLRFTPANLLKITITHDWETMGNLSTNQYFTRWDTGLFWMASSWFTPD